jgi:putative ABC transport system substrate-binding protein
MSNMRRREFVTLLGGAAAAWPLASPAQPVRKMHRIGFLGGTQYTDYVRFIDALRAGLQRIGYDEGKNIVTEYRWAEGRYEQLPALATELVKLNVDALVAPGTPSAMAARQVTSDIPIVFIVGDPVAAGLVTSLARPGGNLTGMAFFFAEICAKRVELIKEAVPSLSRVAVLINPANPGASISLAAMEETAKALNIELVPIEVKARNGISAAIAMVATRGAQALVAIEDPFITSNAKQIAALALQNAIPTIGFRPQAEAGALIEYGVDLAELFFRSASFLDKVLKGVPPADLPIERAVKFEVIVNLKSAKRLRLELPTSLLLRANQVIE